MLQRHVGKHEAAIERLNRVAGTVGWLCGPPGTAVSSRSDCFLFPFSFNSHVSSFPSLSFFDFTQLSRTRDSSGGIGGEGGSVGARGRRRRRRFQGSFLFCFFFFNARECFVADNCFFFSGPPHRPTTHSPLPTTPRQCFELERLINGEIRELRAAAERAQASTSAWAAALAPLDDALRSLGDSESFFGAAAREVEGIAAALSREAAAAAAAAAAEAASEKVKEEQKEEEGEEEAPKR